MRPSLAARRVMLTTALAFALTTSGCQLFGGGTTRQETGTNLAGLQVLLQRFSVEFVQETASALDDYASSDGSKAAHGRALHWKIGMASAALGVASGPNPVANLVDFLVLATLTRVVFEGQTRQDASAAAAERLLATSRRLEGEAWKLGQRVLDEGKRQELRESVDRWLEANPSSTDTFLARPRDLAATILQAGSTLSRRSGSLSVLSLVGLDLLAGLDPAVREFTQSRLVAERALFTVQRMPILIQWQTELLADAFLRRDEISNLRTNLDRVGRAVESISATAARLPERFAAERSALFAALDTHSGPLGELVERFRAALDAGQRMSTALDAAVRSFDALMLRFGVGVPEARSDGGSSDGHAFDVRDYTKAAERIAGAAQELHGTIDATSLALDAPALTRRIDDARSVLDRAFAFGAGLLVLLFALAWVYRRGATRTGRA